MSETLDSNWRPKGNNSLTSIENVFPECRVAVVCNYYTRSSQSPYLRHVDFKCRVAVVCRNLKWYLWTLHNIENECMAVFITSLHGSVQGIIDNLTFTCSPCPKQCKTNACCKSVRLVRNSDINRCNLRISLATCFKIKWTWTPNHYYIICIIFELLLFNIKAKQFKEHVRDCGVCVYMHDSLTANTDEDFSKGGSITPPTGKVKLI